jgi:hypothetical protein
MAVGLILNHAKHNIVIWGSGIHDFKADIPKLNFYIRAIRGPVSKSILIKHNIYCPEVFGDPAILLPDFFYPFVNKVREYIIIPHYSKEKIFW